MSGIRPEMMMMMMMQVTAEECVGRFCGDFMRFLFKAIAIRKV
jgi:hypothetical protein